MSDGNWLQISEYSNKYGVSVSTLRRRIKANEVEHRFDDGKYWLPDEQIKKYVRHNAMKASPARQAVIQSTKTNQAKAASTTSKSSSNWVWDVPKTTSIATPAVQGATTSATAEASNEGSSDALAVAKAMVSELKSAYVLILQEKEEQLLQLREEITDLRTLCRILESENEKLKSTASESPSKEDSTSEYSATPISPITDWLLDEPMDMDI